LFVTEQMRAVAATLLFGFAGGFLYDVYRAWRRTTRPGPRLTALCDLVFWLVLAGAFFAVLMPVNQGEMRLYFLLGLGGGALCYFRFCSPAALRMLGRMWSRVGALRARCTARLHTWRTFLRRSGNSRR
jgi:spore cortex biosynthesis protein YabQ